MTDTLTVRISTVLADSVRTGLPDRFLVGKYTDPVLGKIQASSYTWMSIGEQKDMTDMVYDSLNLFLFYSYSYGDTLPEQEVSIHRVTEDITTDKVYYNSSSVAYDPTPLATKKFSAKPDSIGFLKVSIPGSLGPELFALLKNSDNQTNDILHKTLKGMALIPGDKNTAILGFTGSTFMSMYYHKNTVDTVALNYNIYTTLTNSLTGAKYRAGFNKITSDRSGTVLSGIKPHTPLPPSATNNRSFVQDALGVMTKIEIPYLNTLGKGKPVIINRAQLTLKPDQSIVAPGLRLPNYMVLIETDSTNKIKRGQAIDYELVVNSDANGYNSLPVDPQVAPLVSQGYTFYITTQLQAILTQFKKNNSFLLTPVYTNPLTQQGNYYFPQLLSNSVNRIAFKNNSDDIKLLVFYTEAGK